MRIVQLTAGTGSFYCGTCLRDNALVVELRRQGHDALLVPLYLPLILDEEPATEGVPVFYGGINVYLQQKAAVFRNTPRWLDRLLDVRSLLKSAGSKSGMTSPRELAQLTISMLRGEDGHQKKELERLVNWLAADVKPEVVNLSNALLIGMARCIKERTGARVVCSLQGEDTFLDSFPMPDREEAWSTLRERARDVDAFTPVSRYYGELMQERLQLPTDRVQVVYPGIRFDGYAPASPPHPPVLGYLARLNPCKGLETLIEAFILLRCRGRIPRLKLRAVGACTGSDQHFVERMKARLAEKGLIEEAEFIPNVSREEKIRLLQGMSLLSVPATYGESFGMYVIEALAAGVPAVQPRHAAFPELIEETGAGILCQPDDPLALAQAIESALESPGDLREMGRRGREAVLESFSVERMAHDTLAVFQGSPEREAVGAL